MRLVNHEGTTTATALRPNKARHKQVASAKNIVADTTEVISEAANEHAFKTSDCLSLDEFLALSQFVPHDLSQLKNASLMDRVDTKFLVPRFLLPTLLQTLKAQYTALEIEGQRVSRYENDYYDTPSFTHYLAHHNKRLNRFKLRKRVYTDSDIAFLEVKFKNNKGRTVKTRQPADVYDSSINAENREHLDSAGLNQFPEHKVVQNSSYNRIALAREEAGERLDRNSVFFKWAREHGLRTCSFSKYCMGIFYTGPDSLKRNNFRKIDRHITVAGQKFSHAINTQPAVY